MYGSNDLNMKGVFVALFLLAIVGLLAVLGGGIWGFWWLFTHLSIAIV